MASQQNGYAIVPHDSYNDYRSYCLSHGINVDYAHGNQCWDSCALLWYQYGLRLQTGNGMAYGCWTIMKDQNAKTPFIKITNKNDVKRGDVVVFNKHGSYYTGHIAFADEDYKGGSTLRIMGQNQGQGTSSGTPSNTINYNMSYFLGAFRNTKWQTTPPPTPPTPSGGGKKNKFPWVLYASKFRQR